MVALTLALYVQKPEEVTLTGLKECTTDTECEPSFFCCGGWRCISNNEAYVKEHPYIDCMIACYKPPKEKAPIRCKCVDNKCQSY